MKRVTIKGVDVHRARLRRMKLISNESNKELLAAGEVVRKEAQDSIIEGSVSGEGHVPSRPGEPPNRDTANLDKSIDVVLAKSEKTVRVFARAEYAAALEFGTKVIEPRPFMGPALRKHRNRLVQGQVQAAQEVIRVKKGK